LQRHSSKWLTQRALKKHKTEWTDENLKDIVQLLKVRGHQVLTRVAQAPLIEVTRALQSEFTNVRVVDARKELVLGLGEPSPLRAAG
jgi:hypothetical protein